MHLFDSEQLENPFLNLGSALRLLARPDKISLAFLSGKIC